MTITNYHIQNVIRAYGQQISRTHNLNKVQRTEEQEQLDRISISAEAKKRQVIKDIASEVIDKLTHKQNWSGFEREILNKLSQEYGRPLDIQKEETGSNIIFKVIDEKDREVVKCLSFEDSEYLQKRLFELTELVVQENMA
ncbi:MAG: DVU0524 family FlgM-associated protein [Thermodesulfobacteriota bacterium]|nr:DVU0524 family FlgM-associated protein [Thermodesulfobacteriota bacterium]